jgi:hypothetical protein
MRDSTSQTQEVVFDFGTSPHGLPVEPRHTVEEARQAAAPDSLADGVGVGQSAQAMPRSGAAGHPPTSHTFTFTEEQRSAVAYALLNEICWLEESDEAQHPEILEVIHYLSGAREILQGRSE